MLARLKLKRKDMSDIKNKLKAIKSQRRRDILADALNFSKQHKDSLIIVLDPKKDDIIAAYKDHYTAMQVKSPVLGMKTGIVKKVLHGKTDKDVNKGIVTLFQAMDGFLWNLNKKLNPQRSVDNKPKSKDSWPQKKQKPKKSAFLHQMERIFELIARRFMGKVTRN